MKNIVILIVIIIISLTTISCNESDTIPLNFNIEISNYYFGHKQYTTIINNDSLIILKDDFNGETTRTASKLTEKQTTKLSNFLGNYPLSKLKEQYMHPTIEDGVHISFNISINDTHKDIYIENYYVKEIGELSDKLKDLFPVEHIGYYKKNMVMYKE